LKRSSRHGVSGIGVLSVHAAELEKARIRALIRYSPRINSETKKAPV
jgi:hypothetical protein